ncbi:Sec7 domain protein (macronuclear) [Tetrahymena thermophila SB210]|uniref:Sec7 domain protein n=1 Tax=Tetrahymena thermophila (strain SB210) TaxID=312017 RepID=Q22BX7_TETTS|nr:Sec7 domain protein [Tetrahymena thermophila SB210]EAR82781.2 Sec7 domain protein [Tetrahymena thermophila SB210]|eukprot:XP_001030444.2 Sec7 domain protein [Tetrahymena thermophila SB210]
MSTNIEQELLQTFLKIREYKKQTSYYISLSFERLYQIVVFQRDQYTIKDIIIKMFEFEENNEFIHIALISCVNKIFKYTIFDLQHLQEGEQTWISPQAIVEILYKLANVVINESTLDIYISKKLNLLKTILELPLEYISSDVFEVVWNLLQVCEQIPSIEIKEQSRDTIFFTVVSYIERVIANHNNDIQRIDYILQILSSKINKFYESYYNTPQGRTSDSIKAIEQPLQLLIFAIQLLKRNNLLNNHLQFIQRDFLFTLSKLSRLESVGIYSKILQAFEIIFECYKSGKILDTIQTRFLFGQIIYLKLKQCLKKKEEKEISSEFLCLMNFLKGFLSDRENLIYIYQKNDFMIQNQPLLNEMISIIIELSKEKYDKDDFKYITAYSSDLLMGLLTYQKQSKNVDEQKVQSLYQLYQSNKLKWTELFNIFNENPKDFLKKIASFKQVQDFRNLDDDSIKQITRFLRVYSDINQKHMIEILGGTEKFHNKCLIEYLKLFNFSQISILEATRVVFSTFLMTGETQQVLRFLEAYSNMYFENNNHMFLSSDSIYVYISAMMMLHSDLHNENNQNKMQLEQFINQVRGCNLQQGQHTGGVDLPKEFVTECYQNIQKEEIRECRNFHTSQYTTKIIWNYLESDQEFNKDTNNLSFIEPELVEIDNDPEMKQQVSEKAIFDLILSNIISNIDSIIIKFFELDEESVSQFIESLITLCVQNDKTDQIELIFSNFYINAKVENIGEQDEKSIQYLFCCFLMLKKAFAHIKVQRPQAIKLLTKTTKIRSSLIRDSLAQRCNLLMKKIRESNDFYNQNKHNSRSILDIFSNFLVQEEQSDDEQEEKSIVSLQQRVPYDISSIYAKRFKNENLTSEILSQTLLLDDKEYEDLINSILNEFNGYSIAQFSQRTHTFAHLIDICIQIMKKNQDRVEKVWEKICILLKLGFSRDKVDKKDPLLFQIDNENLKSLIFTLNEMSILKKKKKTFLHSFSKFCLLELCMNHMHLCDKFNSYDDCLQEGLNYLDNCSLQLLEEFNVQLNTYIASNQLFECRKGSYLQALKMFDKIQEVLNGKNLEKQEVITNCVTLKDSIGNFAYQLNNISDDEEYVQVLIQTMKLFENYLKSKIFKVLDAEIYALNLLQGLIISEGARSNQIKAFDRELNATLLQALLSLILCVKDWSQSTVEQIIKMIQRTIVQIRYKYVSDELFRQIYDCIRLCQNKILLFKNDQILRDYINILSSLFLNWINKERFNEIFLNPFIVNLAEIHKFSAENQLNQICTVIKSKITEIFTHLSNEGILKQDSLSVQKCNQICQKYNIQVSFHQIFNIPYSPQASQQSQQLQQLQQEKLQISPKFYSQQNLNENNNVIDSCKMNTDDNKTVDSNNQSSQNELNSNQEINVNQQKSSEEKEGIAEQIDQQSQPQIEEKQNSQQNIQNPNQDQESTEDKQIPLI